MEEILHHLISISHPNIYGFFYMPGGCLKFLSSTVSPDSSTLNLSSNVWTFNLYADFCWGERFFASSMFFLGTLAMSHLEILLSWLNQ